jgi:hypothetical protein
MKAKFTSLGFVPDGQCGADFRDYSQRPRQGGPSARLTYECSEHFSSASVEITEKLNTYRLASVGLSAWL